MDQIIHQHLDDLKSKDANKRYASYIYLIDITQEPVSWAYDAWDDLLMLLKSEDNHERSIAAQLLSSLAKSDPKKRLLKDLDHLIKATKDERFVTARHSLQSLWKVALAGQEQEKMVVAGLTRRFKECIVEKNCTLIRYDILEVFRKIYDLQPGNELLETALALIETEEDAKYKKKYRGLWKEFIVPKKDKG
jgi:hypothetical protein